MPPKGPSGREKFKSKIEKGVERALPAERVKDLEEKVKEKTEERNKLKKTVSESIKKGFTNKETQDLAITAAEKQQIYKNVLASLANKLGGANEAKDLLKSFNIKSARDLMQKIGLSRIQEQKTYEHYSYAAKKGPGICFRDYDKIVEQPWGKKVIEQAFNNKHEYVFAFANKLNKNPEYAKDLLQRATAKSPKLAFHYVEKFKNMDGAKDILKDAITRMDKTDLVFEAFNRYADAPWAINVLKFATEKNRDDAFLHLSRYKKSPEASQVLLTAINQMEDTEDFFRNIDKKLKGVAGVKQVLAAAAVKTPDAAIKHFDKYSDIDDPNYILQVAVSLMTDTTSVFYYAEKIIKFKGAEHVLMQAALKGADADSVFDAYYTFKDLNNAGQILMIAVNNHPKTFFKRTEIWGDLPKKDMKPLLNAAISANPDLAFNNIDAVLKFDESGSVLVNAASARPLAMYKNLPKFEAKIDESIKSNILKAAFAGLKPVDYMSLDNIKIIGPYLTKEQINVLKDKIAKCRQFADKFLEQNIKTAATGYYESKSSYEMRQNLFEDEGLQDILKVKTEWLKIPKGSDLQPVQARAMIARNLFTDGVPVTKENVQKELNRIIEDRNRLKNMNIFKGRNVLHVSQNEKHHVTGRNVFGKEATIEGIKKQSGSMEKLRCEPNREQVKEFKQKLISKIANTKPPLTFYYAGHGSGDSVDLISRGGFKLKLTPADLALALKQRHENFKEDPVEKEKPPIIIISACYTANFARKMYKKIQHNSGKPITMGGSEFGQVSYSARHEQKYDSPFDEHVLGLGSKKPSTFGTVIKNEKKDLSNTYVHLPTKRQVI